MEEKILTKQVGLLIRRLRRNAGMSQEVFADHCGLHRTYIGSIERGEKTISIETANRLARALHLSLAELFVALETEAQDNP